MEKKTNEKVVLSFFIAFLSQYYCVSFAFLLHFLLFNYFLMVFPFLG